MKARNILVVLMVLIVFLVVRSDASAQYVPPTPTPTPSPTPTPIIVTPTPIVAQVLQCPAGFVGTVSGSNIICLQQVQNQAQTAISASSSNSNSTASVGNINVTTTAGATAQGGSVTVAGVTQQGIPALKELPKTGLPSLAWGLVGLLPVGFTLSKFGRNNSDLANCIWWKRARYLV